MYNTEVKTITKSLPLLRWNTCKSLIFSYSAYFSRIFRKNKDNVAFFGLLSSDTSKRKIEAFKAYLTVGSNAAPRLSLNFGDDNVTTGINTITNGEQKADIIYDLSGRRVMNIQRAGIYIVNGQKRLIK